MKTLLRVGGALHALPLIGPHAQYLRLHIASVRFHNLDVVAHTEFIPLGNMGSTVCVHPFHNA